MTKKILCVLIFVVAFATAAAAQQVRVSVHRSPLRAAPTTASAILYTYEIGAILDLIEVTDGWCRVRDVEGKREGFIKATLLEMVASPGQPKPAAARRGGAQALPKPDVRGVLELGATWMTASESFKAVTDTNMRMQYGGGVQVVNLWKGLYAEGIVGWSRLSGSRVFVYDGSVYDLNIPTTITFTPIDAGAGWRVRHNRKVHSYIGGGVEFLKYREESDFASAEDDVDEVFTGYYASGGLEVQLAKWLHLRGEGRYTFVPDALGAGGVSVDFNETNLGGFSVAVKLAIGK